MSWLRALAVAEFDVDVGQTIAAVYPPGSLSDGELKKLAYLSLPDSNTAQLSDVTYSFRLRCDTMPLWAAAPGQHDYELGVAYFRQRADTTVRRGFVQQSLVALSHHPFLALWKQVVRVVGGAFFAAVAAAAGAREVGDASDGDARPPHSRDVAAAAHVLEAAFHEASRWPSPVSGVEYVLPLLGSRLPFTVPWLGMHGHGLPRSRHVSRTATAVASRCYGRQCGCGGVSRRRQPHQCSRWGWQSARWER